MYVQRRFLLRIPRYWIRDFGNMGTILSLDFVFYCGYSAFSHLNYTAKRNFNFGLSDL